MKNPHGNSRPTPNNSSPSGPRSKTAKAESVPKDKEPTSKFVPQDLLDLGDRSALQRFVQEEAKRIPDIRQDRVNQIRTALQSRKYHVSSGLLADKIIKDILLDESSAQD